MIPACEMREKAEGLQNPSAFFGKSLAA